MNEVQRLRAEATVVSVALQAVLGLLPPLAPEDEIRRRMRVAQSALETMLERHPMEPEEEEQMRRLMALLVQDLEHALPLPY